MADYFETDVLYRMKHVLAGQSKREPCGISKEIDWPGGGFFKYQYLEQYEDTLNNVEFSNEEKGQMFVRLFPDAANEYIIKYMLRHETDGSASILDVQQFQSPFEYKLRVLSHGKGESILPVDLVETFNYLLGLRVARYWFLNNDSRKYAMVFGHRGPRRTAVVWRPTSGIDLKKDKELVEKAFADLRPDEIFINGDAHVENYTTIESEFRALMGA